MSQLKSRHESQKIWRETSKEFSTNSPDFAHTIIFQGAYQVTSSGVLSVHRKRDLPAGERRQGSSRESATKLRHSRATGGFKGDIEEALAAGVVSEESGERGRKSEGTE